MKTVNIPRPIKGINTVSNETNIQEGFVRSALNVDIDKEGNVLRRNGYTKIYSGDCCHSLFESYFVEGDQLKFLTDDNTAINVAGLNSNNRFVTYTKVNNILHFSDGIQNIRLLGETDARFIAPPNPPFQPVANMTVGKLTGGVYQFAICTVDTDGIMSGTGVAGTINVSHGNGIEFTKIPSAMYDIAIFISNANGTQLYLRDILPIGTNTASYVNSDDQGAELDTQFMEQLPSGQILRYFKGKLYVASKNILYFSQPHRYGLYDPSEDFFKFASEITIVEPVEDGLFVVADKTYFLRGTDSDDVTLDDFVSVDTGVPGTGLQVSANDFGLESDSDIAFWVSNKGMVIGLPGGNIKNLTEDNVAMDINFLKGTSMYQEVDGKKQILTTLNGGGESSAFTSTDTVTSTIIRNGVEIT